MDQPDMNLPASSVPSLNSQQSQGFPEKSLRDPRLDNTPVYQTQITNLYPLIPDNKMDVSKFAHYCDSCQLGFTTNDGFETHKKSYRHTVKVEELKKKGSYFGKEETSRSSHKTPHDSSDNERSHGEDLHFRKKKRLNSGKADMNDPSNPNLVPLGSTRKFNSESKYTSHKDSRYCETCAITCKNAELYEDHLKSYQHTSNLQSKRRKEDGQQMALPTKFVGNKTASSRGRGKKIVPLSQSLKKSAPEDFMNSQNHAFCENLKAREKAETEVIIEKNEAKIMKDLRKTNEPLIGLEYITEYQSDDEDGAGDARYVCDLCKCSMEQCTVVSHIIGNRHRLSYLKHHFPYQYDLLSNLQICPKELNRNVAYQAEQIEKKYGRHNINIAFKNYEVPGLTGAKTIPESLNDRIYKSKEPLIGMEHVTEYQFEDPMREAFYHCDLCDVRGSANSMELHVAGVKHRLNYAKINAESKYNSIINKNLKGSELTQQVAWMASEMEKKFGRQEINYANANDFRTRKEIGRKRSKEDDDDDDNNKMSSESESHEKEKRQATAEAMNDFVEEMKAASCAEYPASTQSEPNQASKESTHESSNAFYKEGTSSSTSTAGPSFYNEAQASSTSTAGPSFYNEATPTTNSHAQFQQQQLQMQQQLLQQQVQQMMQHQPQLPSMLSLQLPQIPSQPSSRPMQQPVLQPSQQAQQPPQEMQQSAEQAQSSRPNYISPSELNKLLNFTVLNEEDAELALQICNAMTNALLRYRLDNMPNNMLSDDLKFVHQMVNKDSRDPRTPTENNATPAATTPNQPNQPTLGTLPLDNTQLLHPFMPAATLQPMSLNLPMQFPYPML